MKIIDIFVVVEKSLLAVRFEDNSFDTFKNFFDLCQNIEYLEQFFEDNKQDLENGIFNNLSVEDAIIKTIDDASKFEQHILKAAKNSNSNSEKTLENIVFQSLHKDVYSNEYIESKAYVPHNRSFLRLYAIRLVENVYIVSGGAIKLTKSMPEAEHLKEELKKLELTKEYLKENFIIDEEDLGYIEFGKYDEE